ncbi:hypothetical protein BP00DRAFT_144572 [Aspergillus indologenus CBS 114.80]|uniref:Uncharacterized protein n=1 Tax=Aspergillus indologenus CBS 114.80 TaxID=1450541 RepID=A0A2V5J5A1_9EURO|nr:hypothetical protein BP00DRAFT_144572 [Aspergillus indologenus CBS 114.80]
MTHGDTAVECPSVFPSLLLPFAACLASHLRGKHSPLIRVCSSSLSLHPGVCGITLLLVLTYCTVCIRRISTGWLVLVLPNWASCSIMDLVCIGSRPASNPSVSTLIRFVPRSLQMRRIELSTSHSASANKQQH